MTITKFATATLVAASFASASFAGTLTEPEVLTVEEVDTAGSSAGSSGGGILLPLLALAVVAALVASDDS